MVEIAIGIGGVLLMLSGYFLGERLTEQRLGKAVAPLKRVQRAQNQLIRELKDGLRNVKADAAQLEGLWATDQPELIRHHAKRERFFCIGHPERKL